MEGSIAYRAAHPDQFLGICHFQFADKVWKCPVLPCSDTEGSFGTHSHTNQVLCTVNYVPADFTHWDKGTRNEPLKPDMLTRNPTYNSVVRNYT